MKKLKSIFSFVSKVILFFGVFISIVFSIFLIIQYSDFCYIFSNTTVNSELGELGTFLGGYITPALSVITVLLVYLTYNSQKKELNEQRQEFSLTRAYDLLYRETDSINNTIKDFEAEHNRKFAHKAVDLKYHSEKTIPQIFSKNKLGLNLNFSQQYDSLVSNDFILVDELYKGFMVIQSILSGVSNNITISSIVRYRVNSYLHTYLSELKVVINYCSDERLIIENYKKQLAEFKIYQIDFMLSFTSDTPKSS